MGRHRRQAPAAAVLGHFSGPLWLAVRGVAGALPFHADSDAPEAWVSKLEAEAKRFRKR